MIDHSDPENPAVIANVACPGSQHDVSVWKDLLFLSVDSPRSGPGCDSVPASPGFEGIRIFDVSDPANPTYVGAVRDRLRLAHAHPGARLLRPGRVLLYVASYPSAVLAESPYGTPVRGSRPTAAPPGTARSP